MCRRENVRFTINIEKGGAADQTIINGVLEHIRHLNKQTDALKLALGKSPFLPLENPSLEYQGIDLESAGSLYIDYNKKLNELEARQREYAFLISQMHDPHFEISSLSTVLNDHVSTGMIQKASQLVLDLKDRNNRSDKELEQLKEDLALQRGFLQMHLEQISQLNKLYSKLYEEKIYSLLNVKLELIEQEIAISEKNLQGYIATRMENLKQERSIIENHRKELHLEMAALPKKWAAEKLIEQNLEKRTN